MEVQQTITTKSVVNLWNVAFILLRFLFIAMLFTLMVVAIKTGYTRPLSVLKNLLDGFNGVYGSYLVIILCGTGLSAAVGRHLKLWFPLQSLVEDYYLSPLSISSAAMFLVLKSSENVTLHHQILALSMFLGAQHFRFSGTQDNIKFRNRLLCRMNEYVFYWSVLQFNQIWSLNFLLPAAIIVCICRSQEFFQIWREDFKNKIDQANEGMKRMDNILSSGDYISSGSSAFQGLFRIPHQHTFLWDQGSGMLMFLSLYILGLSCIVILKSSETITWKVAYCGVCIAFLIFILLQILPGLFVRLDRAFEHIKQGDPLIKILQVSWFYEIASFLRVLAMEGLPVEDGPPESESLWSSVWKKTAIEGIELIGYVIIFAIARALARVCLAFLILLLKSTGLGIKMEPLWCRWRTKLAYFIAYLSITDIMSTLQIIKNAKTVLETKDLCIKISEEYPAEVLQKAKQECNPSIAIGLFQCMHKTMKEVILLKMANLEPLWKLLDLLHRSSIGPMWKKHDPKVALTVVTEMDILCEDLTCLVGCTT